MNDYDELASLYSEACQAFVLRDFDTTASTVDSLLERIERDELGRPIPPISEGSSDSATELDELVRRVWILQITLLASSDEELVRNPKQAERELAGLHSRIVRFYAQKQEGHPTASTSSSSTSTTLLHPSLLVAISLAGLKLEIPQFARRSLQDYFRLLLSHASTSEAALSSSQGDISTVDASHADLSLSGIAVNGHINAGSSSLNGANGHLVSDMNGTSAPFTQPASSAQANRIRSLHRLARIYTIHLLGKSFGEWSAARTWIREQADDDAALAVGLMNDSFAQTLLETLEETKRQQEEEELEARQTEKQDKERQAELAKKSKQRSPALSSAQSSKTGNSTNANGQAIPMRPERSKDRTQGSTSLIPDRSSSSTTQSDPSSSLARRNNEQQETGFSAFRSRITTFLSTDPHSSLSHSSQNRDISYNPRNPTNSFDLIRLYLSKIIHSKLLKFILAFFIITGFWRRRLARSGMKGKSEIGKTLSKLKDKVLETVKMGGSLGFL